MIGVSISLTLIAIGAIARYAVADAWDTVNIPTVGLILIVVGAVGLVISLVQMVATEWPRDGGSGPRA